MACRKIDTSKETYKYIYYDCLKHQFWRYYERRRLKGKRYCPYIFYWRLQINNRKLGLAILYGRRNIFCLREWNGNEKQLYDRLKTVRLNSRMANIVFMFSKIDTRLQVTSNVFWWLEKNQSRHLIMKNSIWWIYNSAFFFNQLIMT